MKGISYISKKLSPRYFYRAFLPHSLHGDIVRKDLIRGFAVADDERPEGFAWAIDGFVRQTA
jgi:hypothetical protein